MKIIYVGLSKYVMWVNNERIVHWSLNIQTSTGAGCNIKTESFDDLIREIISRGQPLSKSLLSYLRSNVNKNIKLTQGVREYKDDLKSLAVYQTDMLDVPNEYKGIFDVIDAKYNQIASDIERDLNVTGVDVSLDYAYSAKRCPAPDHAYDGSRISIVGLLFKTKETLFQKAGTDSLEFRFRDGDFLGIKIEQAYILSMEAMKVIAYIVDHQDEFIQRLRSLTYDYGIEWSRANNDLEDKLAEYDKVHDENPQVLMDLSL